MNISALDTMLDRYVDKALLWAVPKSIKPNHFTYFRIVSAPIIFILLAFGYLKSGFVLFVVSMLTDLIDGALARTRNQITSLGKVIDPIADKLLVLTVFLYIGFKEPIALIFSAFIFIEIVGVIIGVVMDRYFGPVLHPGANTYGKIKMWFQCFGAVLYLLGRFGVADTLIRVSIGLLIIGFFFAVISAFLQTKSRWDQFRLVGPNQR